jgi:hypothetical protein
MGSFTGWIAGGLRADVAARVAYALALKMLLKRVRHYRIKFHFWNTTWNQNFASTAEAT